MSQSAKGQVLCCTLMMLNIARGIILTESLVEVCLFLNYLHWYILLLEHLRGSSMVQLNNLLAAKLLSYCLV